MRAIPFCYKFRREKNPAGHLQLTVSEVNQYQRRVVFPIGHGVISGESGAKFTQEGAAQLILMPHYRITEFGVIEFSLLLCFFVENYVHFD